MSQPAPIHTHDCDCCRFLGTINSAGEWGDLYVCERNSNAADRSVIFRFGSDGPEYSSMPRSMTARLPETHPLRMAASLYTRL